MEGKNYSNSRIFKNSVFLYIRMFLVLITTLYTTKVVLLSLGVVDFGIYNVVAGFVSMFAFLNTSMINSIQRFISYHMGCCDFKKVSETFYNSLISQVVLAVILIILLETIGLVYIENVMVIPEHRKEIAMYCFQFAVLSMVISVIQAPFGALIIAFEKMSFFAYISICDVTSKLALAYIISKVQSDRLFVYGLGILLITLLTFIAYYTYSKVNFKEMQFKSKPNRENIRNLLSFSGWNVFGTFSYMMKSQGLNMLLNVYFGPAINASRAIATMIMNAVQGFQNNIVLAFRSQLIQAYANNDTQRATYLFLALSRASYFMLSMIAVPLILEIDYVLNLWLEGEIPPLTQSFSILVLWNMLLSSLNTPVSQLVHATGKMKKYQICTSLTILSIVPISWLFVHCGCSPTSVFWVSLVITAVNQHICLMVLKEIYDYSLSDYYRKVILPCCIFSALVFAACYIPFFLINESFIRLLIVSITALLTSGVCGYVIFLQQHERQYLVRIIKKHIL